MTRTIAAALGLSVAMAGGALAHDDVSLKEKARQLGVAVGQHYVCTPAEEREAVKRNSEAMFDTILRGVGHETAYLYAVSVGFGAAGDQTDVDCEALAAQLEQVKVRMRIKGAAQ